MKDLLKKISDYFVDETSTLPSSLNFVKGTFNIFGNNISKLFTYLVLLVAVLIITTITLIIFRTSNKKKANAEKENIATVSNNENIISNVNETENSQVSVQADIQNNTINANNLFDNGENAIDDASVIAVSENIQTITIDNEIDNETVATETVVEHERKDELVEETPDEIIEEASEETEEFANGEYDENGNFIEYAKGEYDENGNFIYADEEYAEGEYDENGNFIYANSEYNDSESENEKIEVEYAEPVDKVTLEKQKMAEKLALEKQRAAEKLALEKQKSMERIEAEKRKAKERLEAQKRKIKERLEAEKLKAKEKAEAEKLKKSKTEAAATVISTTEKPTDPVTTNGKFVIEKKKDGYHFVLIAPNGTILLESPRGYVKPDGAINGIETFKIAAETGEYVIDKDETNLYRFYIKPSSGSKQIYTSFSYNTKASCLSATKSVKKFSNIATIISFEDDVNNQKNN